MHHTPAATAAEPTRTCHDAIGPRPTIEAETPHVGAALESDDIAGLYAAHAAAVYNIASHVCGSALAADVTQDVFIAISQRPTKYDPARGSMRGLLSTMAHHRAVDVLRSHTARVRREGRDAGEPRHVVHEIDADVMRHERLAAITRALDKLQPDTREAIVLAYFGELTYRQVATELRIPEGTVKSRIRHGLLMLRHELSTAHDELPWRDG